jgi:hypothetical protein
LIFIKVWWGEIFIEFMIFNKTINFMKVMKVMISKIIYDDNIFYESLVRWNIYRIYDF